MIRNAQNEIVAAIEELDGSKFQVFYLRP